MTEQDENQPAEEFHRDRREHGGIPGHLDDDQLARLTEEERVAAGLDDFDPDEVPAATDAPPAAFGRLAKQPLLRSQEARPLNQHNRY